MKIDLNPWKYILTFPFQGGRGVHGSGQKSYQNWNKNKLHCCGKRLAQRIVAERLAHASLQRGWRMQHGPQWCPF